MIVKGFKSINDLDKEYDKGLIEKGDVLVCPVCDKEYKRKSAAEKHLEARDCFSLSDLYVNTVYETRAYGIYRGLVSVISPKSTVSLGTFRKSPYYNGSIRMAIFSAVHSMNHQQQTYFDWLIEFKGCGQINSLLSLATKESTLREFRKFLIQFDQFIESKEFYPKNRQFMISDPAYFVRSLETAQVSLRYILERDDFPFEVVMESMTTDDQMRFDAIVQLATKGEDHERV